ncbi:peptide-methionine (R)-S-oxide reductase [Tenacibaculum adriaticum]|uniref:peptide-methionine (R)-S-oxide reductase n=1 Tax=Tenacibaculum adriaticum TaxID=413713 RepID=A0A5S5DWK3_9FLAO|nr:peptide-methionine (R)-S-oxide reductase MsrB [Tenacibaculum adriaticum]TYP99152.1 peptide-methionine (R)-S-oxide reductase [Tenacibaculum adriaticum]
MKKIVFILFIGFLISCQSTAQNKKMENKKYKVENSEAEWKKKLTPMQFHVLREAGTERPGTSEFNDFQEKGTYVCAACNTPLYKSDRKFDAHCGWPSFDEAIEENIELDVDYKIGYERTELKCKTCGSHLGHRFNDGPKETTGQRHCLNGVALKFIPEKK